eukprot:CAMPEP_0197275668 /NCGR_PEP_ID=MMETSP1432-20130617/14207_1 /TAXON_ID=44447 /ORGANISM="Pseudo-nitzschia delicatissima, Strain UNC1205" /LENGTH=212 /DNA_ID=CAMNT_0042741593 /DNA_START=67 /DNA_END=705 /DNA_ORIENTATION=+
MGDNDCCPCCDENPLQLTEEHFGLVLKSKSDGNGSFGDSDWNRAEEHYGAALAFYLDRGDGIFSGPQRDTQVALFSNMSMVHLKQERFLDAERTASSCLELDPDHGKASYRRAMARLQISRRTPGGDAQRIEKARGDATCCNHGDARNKLLQRIENEARRIETIEDETKKKKKQKQFCSGFASAVDSGERSSSATPPVHDACCSTDTAGVVS